MSNLVERTITITSEFAPLARQLCACVPMGDGMFERQYGDGDTVIGYISAGPILEQFSDVLPVKIYTSGGIFVEQKVANYGFLIGMAAQAGIIITEVQLATLFDQADISDQTPDAVMERLGYRLM